jgi:alpha-ketoglutarate-dependent 2,4-dichlorophenoxyacetate dioxygenase
MATSIRQLHPILVGEVSGADLTKPLSREDVAAIEAGMDKYAVLIFHDQKLTDNPQMAVTHGSSHLTLHANDQYTVS